MSGVIIVSFIDTVAIVDRGGGGLLLGVLGGGAAPFSKS